MKPSHEEIANIVRQIPRGKCTSYGRLGALMPIPMTGREMGRWLFQFGSEVPWWRVVAHDGTLSIAKLSPIQAKEQDERLAEEDIPFKGSRVDLSQCLWEP